MRCAGARAVASNVNDVRHPVIADRHESPNLSAPDEGALLGSGNRRVHVVENHVAAPYLRAPASDGEIASSTGAGT